MGADTAHSRSDLSLQRVERILGGVDPVRRILFGPTFFRASDRQMGRLRRDHPMCCVDCQRSDTGSAQVEFQEIS